MDPKLKALATEYEKARKQNLQLRQALSAEKDKNKSLTEEIEQLKNRPIEVQLKKWNYYICTFTQFGGIQSFFLRYLAEMISIKNRRLLASNLSWIRCTCHKVPYYVRRTSKYPNLKPKWLESRRL